jgi:hypothetical protein
MTSTPTAPGVICQADVHHEPSCMGNEELHDARATKYAAISPPTAAPENRGSRRLHLGEVTTTPHAVLTLADRLPGPA